MDWLDDMDINLSLKIIADSSPDAAMVGYPIPPQSKISTLICSSFYFESLRLRGMECISKWIEGLDLSKINSIIFPVYSENHWSLCYIDVKKETAKVFDSLRPCHLEISSVLLLHSLVKKVLYSSKCTQQKNGSDCGRYVLYYARCLVANKRDRLNREVPPKFLYKLQKWIKKRHEECAEKERKELNNV
ncbi:hypothetical protein NEAUS03_2243 [Nematocida ausubeli]|nr:hypothetical protein NEAUS03_2243 [Nematocida ausubeli]